MIIYEKSEFSECPGGTRVGVAGDNSAFTQEFYIRGISDDSISYSLHLRFSDGTVNSVVPDLVIPEEGGTLLRWIIKKNDIFRHGYFEVQIEGRNSMGLIYQTEIVRLYADESIPVEDKTYENPNSETLKLREEAYSALDEIKKQEAEIKANVELINQTSLSSKADKSTTLGGYGITDAYTKDECDFDFVPYKATRNIVAARNGEYSLNGITVTVTNYSHFRLSGTAAANTLISIPIKPLKMNGTYCEHIENVVYENSANTYGSVAVRSSSGVISGSSRQATNTGGTVTADGETEAVVIAVYVASGKTAEWEFDYQLEAGDSPTAYIAPRITEIPVEDGSITSAKLSDELNRAVFGNKLSGKSIYCDGDSIAYGMGSGGYSYCDFIADKYNMNMTKTAKSGTTIAVRDGRSDSILERVKATTGDFDYILLDGGINDLAYSVPFGELTAENWTGTFDETTIIGALESLCQQLCTKWYEAKKLFVLVHKRTWYWGNRSQTKDDSGNPLPTQQELYEAMKSVLRKWGIPYVDISAETNLTGWDDSTKDKYFMIDSGTGHGDGLHPTKEAYEKFYLPVVEKALRG